MRAWGEAPVEAPLELRQARELAEAALELRPELAEAAPEVRPAQAVAERELAEAGALGAAEQLIARITKPS
jgi:hypothetical protein